MPHTGILSRTAANRPWVAYSWGYEVLMSRAYAWFGLLGIGLYGTLLTVGVAFAVYWMLRRISGRFWTSIGLAVTYLLRISVHHYAAAGFLLHHSVLRGAGVAV